MRPRAHELEHGLTWPMTLWGCWQFYYVQIHMTDECFAQSVREWSLTCCKNHVVSSHWFSISFNSSLWDLWRSYLDLWHTSRQTSELPHSVLHWTSIVDCIFIAFWTSNCAGRSIIAYLILYSMIWINFYDMQSGLRYYNFLHLCYPLYYLQYSFCPFFVLPLCPYLVFPLLIGDFPIEYCNFTVYIAAAVPSLIPLPCYL